MLELYLIGALVVGVMHVIIYWKNLNNPNVLRTIIAMSFMYPVVMSIFVAEVLSNATRVKNK